MVNGYLNNGVLFSICDNGLETGEDERNVDKVPENIKLIMSYLEG